MAQALLRARRLTLAPLAQQHLPLEVELDADSAVMRYLGQVRTRTQVEEAHRRRVASATHLLGLGTWAGSVDEEFVGLCSLTPPSRDDQGPVQGQAELGYRLLPRRWGQGSAGTASVPRSGAVRSDEAVAPARKARGHFQVSPCSVRMRQPGPPRRDAHPDDARSSGAHAMRYRRHNCERRPRGSVLPRLTV